MKHPPAYRSLPAACAAAIQFGNHLSDINVCRWANTFACTGEQVRQAWEAELTRTSQQPSNSFEQPEGK